MKATLRFPKRVVEARELDQESIDKAAGMFRQQGALVIEDVFRKQLIQTLQDAFLQEYACMSEDRIRRTCAEVGHQRYMFSVEIRPPFSDPDLYASPLVLPIIKALLGPDCVIQSFGVVCAFPGAKMQHLHRDYPALFEESGDFNDLLPTYGIYSVNP